MQETVHHRSRGAHQRLGSNPYQRVQVPPGTITPNSSRGVTSVVPPSTRPSQTISMQQILDEVRRGLEEQRKVRDEIRRMGQDISRIGEDCKKLYEMTLLMSITVDTR